MKQLSTGSRGHHEAVQQLGGSDRRPRGCSRQNPGQHRGPTAGRQVPAGLPHRHERSRRRIETTRGEPVAVGAVHGWRQELPGRRRRRPMMRHW